MISELKIRNFKSLESVDLKLGHFNLLVGANASGKSNFLDALRFLQGVGNGFNIGEILDGKPSSSTTLKWDGIRGGSSSIGFLKTSGEQTKTIKFEVTFGDENLRLLMGADLKYCLTCSTGVSNLFFTNESLSCGEDFLPLGAYTNSAVEPNASVPPSHSPFPKRISSALITKELPRFDFSTIRTLIEIDKDRTQTWGSGRAAGCALHISTSLADIQFLDLLPTALRNYSTKVAQLGEGGEGFAALIHEIESNGSKPALLEWLKELRPDEVDDIYALEGLNNDFMVAIKEGNKEFRAPSISDGTLRFIALAATFFQPMMPKILVIEEIEKGLHPSRLRLLLELMRSQSKRTGTQVFATTHSPTLLAWLTEEDRKTTFVCTRDAESGATKMRSLAEIPRFEELIEEGSHIDELFAEGWLESAPQ